MIVICFGLFHCTSSWLRRFLVHISPGSQRIAHLSIEAHITFLRRIIDLAVLFEVKSEKHKGLERGEDEESLIHLNSLTLLYSDANQD